MPECRPEDHSHFQSDWCSAALASIRVALMTADTEGRVKSLNPTAESLTGWIQEDAAGKPVDSIFKTVDEETRRTRESLTVQVLRDGVGVGLTNHTLLIAKDGTEWPIDEGAAPIRNDHGEVAGVMLVFRDNTDNRMTEAALTKALAYADDIIATLREPFVVLDHDLRIKTANRSFYNSFQVTREETENRLLFELGNGQWDIARLRKLLEEVLSLNHSVEDFELEHDFPTIGRKTVLLNARRFPPESKNPELILLAIEDIAKRIQSESALKVSEIRYRRLFETAKDGILILDTETGRITDANPFMSDLLGYSHDDFLGKELWEIGLFSDKSENEAAVRTLRETGYMRYDHLPLETNRGLRAEVEIVANAYQEDRHSVIQCNIRDITERSRLEKQMQEQAVALAELHRRKDEFLAMLSHELRNPLAPITSAVQLLGLQNNEGKFQQKARTIIERQVGQLTRLVDDLLEVSRITSGKIRLQQEQVTLDGIVEHAVETVRPLIDQRKHELTVSLSPISIWLDADATRLQQVVVNLLTNAAKFTADGGHIHLATLQEGDEAVIRVRDSGVGIAPEVLPHIFDLFTQAERSLDRSQGGLGIGLSLVRRLVEMHGGRVLVSSVLGAGSEFIVRLPVLAPPEVLPPPKDKETPEPSEPSMRVLVVDDNVDAAEALDMLLTKLGNDVQTAYDGPTGLQAALGFQPNVVLLDLGLPGMDGFEVARQLRKQPLLKSVVLVAMTGYGHDTDRQRSLDAGFDHHLVKPADFVKVKQILATVSETAN